MQDYKNQEIYIGPNNVRFRVNGSDYGGAHNLNQETLLHLAELRIDQSPALYGAALLKACFRDSALQGYYEIRSAIEKGEWKRLRLEIDLAAKNLHALWWECLWDLEDPQRRLGCSPWTPLSRFLPLPANREPVREEKLRVLVVVSNPVNLGGDGPWSRWDQLNEQAEMEVIERALKNLDDRVIVEYQNKPASRLKIRDRLKTGKFHILHIVGHGAFSENRDQGYLLLEKDEDESVEAIDEKFLGHMVEDLIDLRLVILASCHSAKRSDADALVGLAPRLIRAGVPAVIAMQDLVSVDTARDFTEFFYRSLGKSVLTGGMVDVAINNARDSLFFRSPDEVWDWAIPVLFMRGEGLLFAPEARTKTPVNSSPHQPSPVESLSREEKAGLSSDKPLNYGHAKRESKTAVISVVKISTPPFLHKGTADEAKMNFHTSMFHGKIQENLTKTPGLQILDPESAMADIILTGELNYFEETLSVTIRGIDAGGIVRVSITKFGPLDQWEDLSARCVESIVNQILQRALQKGQWKS